MAGRSSQETRRPRRVVRSCTLCACLLACSAAADPSVTLAGNSEELTLVAEDVELRDLLEYLAFHQGLVVEAHAGLEGRITARFVEEPLAAVLRRLLSDHNFTLALGPAGGRLWIHPRAGSGDAPRSRPLVLGSRPSIDDPEAALDRLARGAAGTRLDAVTVLAAWGGDSAFEALAGALADPHPAVREEAVAGLGASARPEAVHLAAQLVADPNEHVREAAIDALSDIGTSAAVERLSSVLANGDAVTRRLAVDALGNIESAEATAALRAARGDPDARVRTLAGEYLAERREPQR